MNWKSGYAAPCVPWKRTTPIDVMFLYRVIELIGDLADVAQRVGSRLQILLAR